VSSFYSQNMLTNSVQVRELLVCSNALPSDLTPIEIRQPGTWQPFEPESHLPTYLH